ncbi:MAG TPA: HEAT repeat domain-containing protein [Pirellulales bacterium]|nr:HEAT repeat domain-containing protein [Pirellulales bacterium]
MTPSLRPIWVLAGGLLLLAGCGRGKGEPHPVAQNEPISGEGIPPGQPGVPISPPAGMAVLPPGAATNAQPVAVPPGTLAASRRRSPFVEWTMQQTALDSLTRIGQPAVPALVGLLDDSNTHVRTEAVIALSRIGPEAQSALPRLIALVESDPDAEVRKNAVRAIGQIGPAAAAAVPVLIDQLKAGPSSPGAIERRTHRLPPEEPKGSEEQKNLEEQKSEDFRLPKDPDDAPGDGAAGDPSSSEPAEAR